MDNQEQLMEQQQQEEHQAQEFQEHQEPTKVLHHQQIKKLLDLELEVDQDQVIHSKQRSHEKND